MNKIALTANTYLIEKDIERETNYAKMFQPFVNQLLKNDYNLEPDALMDAIQNIVKNGTLETFLRTQALRLTPEIDSMPISLDAKLSMMDISNLFKNYSAIQTHYNAIRALTPQLKNKIYSFNLDSENKLQLTEAAIQRIKDSHTTYGNEKHLEYFNKVIQILEVAKELQQHTGLNVFQPGVIQGIHGGRLDSASVNPYAILSITTP